MNVQLTVNFIYIYSTQKTPGQIRFVYLTLAGIPLSELSAPPLLFLALQLSYPALLLQGQHPHHPVSLLPPLESVFFQQVFYLVSHLGLHSFHLQYPVEDNSVVHITLSQWHCYSVACIGMHACQQYS